MARAQKVRHCIHFMFGLFYRRFPRGFKSLSSNVYGIGVPPHSVWHESSISPDVRIHVGFALHQTNEQYQIPMKILNRWKTTLISGFEHVVNQVENHDAVIATAIRETREAAAGARVKLNRLRRDCEKMRLRLAELEQSAATWAARAVKSHPAEPDTALECVRRRNAVLQEAAYLREELSRHEALERQLNRDIVVIDERVAELNRRRNACSAREFRAKAIGVPEEFLPPDVEDVFDRWEIKLTTAEPLAAGEADSLEARFAVGEERASLEAGLDELLRAANPQTQEAR